ncbi:MAG: class I SAM-dependent methyltransferase [Thermoplasmata archaeon]|nr:class I SAM-dependent methyltransferase [Thermoplasmata archaeon]
MKEERWHDLEKSLEKLQPFYDLMNRIMSLDNEKIIRDHSLNFINDPEKYLDAGTGPGTMANLVIKKSNPKKTFLMDPSIELLKINKTYGEKIQAKFENIPFVDGYFNLVTCGFSFRDAISHVKAAKELSRIISKGGRLIIIDIGKPDSRLIQFFYYLYIFLLPILAALIITRGRLIHEYFTLFYTFIEYPEHSKIVKMFESNGLKLIAREKKFGGAIFFDVYEKK